MASKKLWTGVSIAVQSALASAITISAITKANPAVISYSGTDPSNGDYVVLTVQGMNQMHNRVVRVAGVDGGANTFQAEGIDSTLFDTFSSGSGQVITFGTTLNTITDIAMSGGDYDLIDTTTVHDTMATNTPGLAKPLTATMQSFWDPSDTGLLSLKAASDVAASRAIRITFADSTKVVFNGRVGCSMAPTGSAQDKVMTPITITAEGRITAYTS